MIIRRYHKDRYDAFCEWLTENYPSAPLSATYEVPLQIDSVQYTLHIHKSSKQRIAILQAIRLTPVGSEPAQSLVTKPIVLSSLIDLLVEEKHCLSVT